MQQKILISLTSAVFASSLTAGAVYGSPIFSGQSQDNALTQDLIIQNQLTQEKLSETHQQLKAGRTVTSLHLIDPQPLVSPIFSSHSSTPNSETNFLTSSVPVISGSIHASNNLSDVASNIATSLATDIAINVAANIGNSIVPLNTNSVNRPLFSGTSNISTGHISTANSPEPIEPIVAIAPANIPPAIVPEANLPTANSEVINPLLDLATEVAMNSSINLPMNLPMDLPVEVTVNPYLEPETIFEDPSRLTPFQQGIASWYGPGFDGAYTASGEVFDQYAMTAAHPSLPFGTRVMVTNLDSGRSVLVRITDRGPFTGGRVIDLSLGAAESIGMIGSGVADVQISVIEP
jgi:hypothetical protein